jgi:hypothetical protein
MGDAAYSFQGMYHPLSTLLEQIQITEVFFTLLLHYSIFDMGINLLLCDIVSEAVGSSFSTMSEGVQHAIMHFDPTLQLEISLLQAIETVNFG